MAEIILGHHGQEAPPAHNWGTNPIDRIFVTLALHNAPCSYLSSMEAIDGDHCCLWIDLPELHIFGSSMPLNVIAWQLKMEDPQIVKKYHDTFLDTTQPSGQNANHCQSTHWRTQYQPCHQQCPQYIDPYTRHAPSKKSAINYTPRTSALSRLMHKSNIGGIHSTKPLDAHNMPASFPSHLACALELMATSEHMTEDQIRQKLMVAKTQLWHQLTGPQW